MKTPCASLATIGYEAASLSDFLSYAPSHKCRAADLADLVDERGVVLWPSLEDLPSNILATQSQQGMTGLVCALNQHYIRVVR
jgi:hypothetical protein